MGGIPITFEHHGRTFRGHFERVLGAATAHIWHLMDTERYYLGTLRQVEDSWYFDGSKREERLGELAEYFGAYLVAYFDGKPDLW